MILNLADDAESLAVSAADHLTQACRDAVAARGQFLLALSGGSTPWKMLAAWAAADLPWEQVHLFQVDERVAPDGHEDRNWTQLTATLLNRIALPPTNLHPMPVNDADGPARYGEELGSQAGSPPVLDVVQLGMGGDGHTASLIPGDPALTIEDQDVAWCGEYQGRRRMTLTYPCINRARQRMWLVAGEGKREMVHRLLTIDKGIPAGRVDQADSILFTDVRGL